MEFNYAPDLLINSNQDFAIENISAKTNYTDTKFSHIHKFYEILYIYSGEKNITINNAVTSVIDESHIAFVAPYQFHKTELIKKYTHKRILINFTYDFVKTEDDAYNQKMLACFNSPNSVIYFNKHQINDVNNILQNILFEYNTTSDDYSQDIIRTLLTQLLLIASRSLLSNEENGNPNISGSAYYVVMKNIADYINKNFSNSISLEDLSERFNISRYIISREFSRVMNCSFPTYLNNLRIKKSVSLLMDTNASIATIAHDCGYDSIKHFNRVFKNQFNISPTEYRKQNKMSL